MSLSTPTSKHDRRAAMLSPHAEAHEASVQRSMERGIQPKGLPALVVWFREACHGEAPTAIHKSEVWRDHGDGAEGGSKLGTPAWSDPFRRFIESVDYPSTTDGEGIYRFPLRAAMSRMSRRHPITARRLYQLALLDGDWHRLADQCVWQNEEMEFFLETALFRLWREYSDVRLRT